MSTLSKVNRKGGKRGCLCPDGKYRKECCDGTLQAEGVGATITETTVVIIDNGREGRTKTITHN